MEKRILVPVDFSPQSTQIIATAQNEAAREKCGLVLLHVVEDRDPMRQRPPLILTDVLDDYARLIKLIPSELVSVKALEGDPVEVILDAAIACRCHRIVMGHGGKWDRPGHVAAAVQKKFHGPTQLVHPHKDSVIEV